MTTVLICDDDPIVREALGAYLAREEDLHLVATTQTADDALRTVAQQAPDVVLMDLALPGMDGIAATRRLRRSHPGTAVLVLTSFGTDEQAAAALTAGAAGFLLKSTSPEALAAAVRAAHASAGTVISPDVTARLLTGMPGGRPGAPGASPTPAADQGTSSAEELALTDRELEVLALLCAAEPNAGIARRLSLSESTVKSHVSSLMGKLGCSSRLQVALSAFERGLARAPRPAPRRARSGG